MCGPYGSKVWGGLILYLIALLGTWLLASESARPWAVLLPVASAVLAAVLWGRQNWLSAFPCDAATRIGVNRSRLFYLLGVTIAVLLVVAADLRYVVAPYETFGLAGIFWIAGIALLLCSAFFGSHSVCVVSLGVLLVGGMLVAYPNSVPPLINHWTPAFPVFYLALAVPVGAWKIAGESELERRLRWILPATVAIALFVLGWCNLNFYFHRYYA